VEVELRAGGARGEGVGSCGWLVGACGWPSESCDTGAVTRLCGVSLAEELVLCWGADVVVCSALVM
jgi:hypothetical protein